MYVGTLSPSNEHAHSAVGVLLGPGEYYVREGRVFGLSPPKNVGDKEKNSDRNSRLLCARAQGLKG